jgi:hypothetical protein
MYYKEMTQQTLAMLAALAIILDHAHLVSPIAAAWGNRRMRERMLVRWDKFICWPLAIIGLGIILGLEFQRYDRAIEALVGVYVVWNAYHFAMQNFGLLALAGRRQLGRLGFFATLVMLTVPAGVASGVMFPVLSWAHWLTDIGLSSAAAQRWWWIFLILVLPAGLIGFLWKAVDCRVICQTAMYSLPILVATRTCLGFVHFLYSRWVWRRDSPVVSALGWR